MKHSGDFTTKCKMRLYPVPVPGPGIAGFMNGRLRAGRKGVKPKLDLF